MSAVLVEAKFDHHHKPDLRRRSEASPASYGPNSCEPGSWLTDLFVDALDPDPKRLPAPPAKAKAELERLESAAEILNSYRFCPRFRTLLRPVGPHPKPNGWPVNELDTLADQPAKIFIADDTETEETTSHCRLSYNHAASVNSFNMLGQDGALSSVSTSEWNTKRASEFADYKPKRIETKYKSSGGACGLKADNYVAVDDDAMNADYATWLANPSAGNTDMLWVTLHNFLTKKSNSAPSDDRLKQQGQSKEFQQDFILKMLEKLKVMRVNNEIIHDPAHYITRSWHNGRIDALKKLTSENKRFRSVNLPSSDHGEHSESENGSSVGHLDTYSYKQWAHDNYAAEDAAEDPDDVRLRQAAKIDNYPDAAVRDLLRLRLQGKTQMQIGEAFTITQQAVSKKLAKAARLLQTMPEIAVPE